MSPNYRGQQETSKHPTSPWTEAFQATSEAEPENPTGAEFDPAYDSETQEPTHDALSEIYNRGY